MVFDKVLASVGVGSAEVDTVLERDTFRPGEEFAAQVIVEGGEADQEIEGLELRLEVELKEDYDEAGRNKVIDRWHVADEFVIRAGETRTFDFHGRLHPETPVTEVDSRVDKRFEGVWIATTADVDKAVDPTDKDYLHIEPTDPMRAAMEAVERSGFELRRLTTDPDRVQVGNVTADLACDQEFVYRPVDSRFSNTNLEEIEVHFVPRDHETKVLLEFDRHRGSETFRSITVDHHDYSVEGIADAFEREMFGGVNVDVDLDRETVRPGEQFSGRVLVEAGEAGQRVDGLDLELETELKEDRNESGSVLTIDQWRLANRFELGPGETRTFDFQGRIHHETPITEVSEDAYRSFEGVWLDPDVGVDAVVDRSKVTAPSGNTRGSSRAGEGTTGTGGRNTRAGEGTTGTGGRNTRAGEGTTGTGGRNTRSGEGTTGTGSRNTRSGEGTTGTGSRNTRAGEGTTGNRGRNTGTGGNRNRQTRNRNKTADGVYLRVEPTDPMAAMMDAVERAGLRLRRVTTDSDRIAVGDVRADLGCDQEIVYRPVSDDLPQNLEEFELHFLPRPRRDETHVLLEFDRHRGSESFQGMTIDHFNYTVEGLEREFRQRLRDERI